MNTTEQEDDMNTDLEHDDMVCELKKPGEDVLSELSPVDANLVHLALGVAGEAGELVDAIKKATIYGKPLDMENMCEELGDLEFYMAAIRQCCGFTRRDVLRHNIAKLRKRYGGSYSNEAAKARADKTMIRLGSEGTELFCALCAETGHGSAQCPNPSEFKPSRKKVDA